MYPVGIDLRLAVGHRLAQGLAANIGQLAQQDEHMASDEHQYPSSWPVAASGSGWQRSAPLQSRTIHERIRDGWIKWDGVEPLSDWLDAVRPSRVPAQSCAWVSVDNREPRSRGFGEQQWNGHFDEAPYLEALGKIEAIIDSGKGGVSAKDKQACVESLLETAKRQGLTSGKWMVFVTPAVADAVWADVARATAEGKLGSSAKIAPTLGTEKPAALCCAYVHDFGDRAELKRVLLAFQKLMRKHGAKVTAGFKPDVLTHLGITKGEEQHGRFPQARQRLADSGHTTVYRVDEVLHDKWDESHV